MAIALANGGSLFRRIWPGIGGNNGYYFGYWWPCVFLVFSAISNNNLCFGWWEPWFCHMHQKLPYFA